MSLVVEDFLRSQGIQLINAISRHQMVKLHARWQMTFPSLTESSRLLPDNRLNVCTDDEARQNYFSLGAIRFILLSEGASYSCSANCPPDISRLTNDDYPDTFNELILLDEDFSWSLVLVNHMFSVGWYFDQIHQ
jgi:hypothetical protein